MNIAAYVTVLATSDFSILTPIDLNVGLATETATIQGEQESRRTRSVTRLESSASDASDGGELEATLKAARALSAAIPRDFFRKYPTQRGGRQVHKKSKAGSCGKEQLKPKKAAKPSAAKIVLPTTTRGEMVQELNDEYLSLSPWTIVYPNGAGEYPTDELTGRTLLPSRTGPGLVVQRQSGYYHTWTGQRGYAYSFLLDISNAVGPLETSNYAIYRTLVAIRRARQAYQDYLDEQGHAAFVVGKTAREKELELIYPGEGDP